MEVVRHDLRASPSRLYGSGVDMEEFLRVDGAVVLFGQDRSELVGPIDPPQVFHESLVAGPIWADVAIGGGVVARGHARRRIFVGGLAPPLPRSL